MGRLALAATRVCVIWWVAGWLATQADQSAMGCATGSCDTLLQETKQNRALEVNSDGAGAREVLTESADDGRELRNLSDNGKVVRERAREDQEEEITQEEGERLSTMESGTSFLSSAVEPAQADAPALTTSVAEITREHGDTSEALADGNSTVETELAEKKIYDHAGAIEDFVTNPTSDNPGSAVGDAVQEAELSPVASQERIVVQEHPQSSFVDVTLQGVKVFSHKTKKGQVRKIACPDKEHIFIRKARWYASKSNDCSDYHVTAKVKERCHNKQKCEYVPYTSQGGNRLNLGYYCGGKVDTLDVSGDCRSPCHNRSCMHGSCQALTATTWKCNCNHGYRMDGAKCIQDPCVPNPCGKGKCSPRPDAYAYSCLCPGNLRHLSETCRDKRVTDVINILSLSDMRISVACRRSETLRARDAIWYGTGSDCSNPKNPISQLKKRCDKKQTCEFAPLRVSERDSVTLGLGKVCSKTIELLSATFECWK